MPPQSWDAVALPFGRCHTAHRAFVFTLGWPCSLTPFCRLAASLQTFPPVTCCSRPFPPP